jgi:hypothetical protein
VSDRQSRESRGKRRETERESERQERGGEGTVDGSDLPASARRSHLFTLSIMLLSSCLVVGHANSEKNASRSVVARLISFFLRSFLRSFAHLFHCCAVLLPPSLLPSFLPSFLPLSPFPPSHRPTRLYLALPIVTTLFHCLLTITPHQGNPSPFWPGSFFFPLGSRLDSSFLLLAPPSLLFFQIQ